MINSDFFARQDRARKFTSFAIFVYALCVMALGFAIYGVALLSAHAFLDADQTLEPSDNAEIALWSFGSFFLLIFLASLWKRHALSAGGSAVARSMGGRQILSSTRDHRERRFLNIVEEMAIASGVPMPKVFVLDNESGINAFAAGYSPKDAAVAVTKGALDRFSRAELQAVVGHEFSHILNGDMRLNIRIISVVFGILCVSIIGRFAMRVSSRFSSSGGGSRGGKKDNGAAAALAFFLAGLAIWIIGSLGVFFSRIIQAVVSRQREHLADASAIQFTRDPSAMASALKVIGASSGHGRLRHAETSEVSHMLFVPGLAANLFATHPSLLKRIRAIEPGFNGDYNETRRQIQQRLEAAKTGKVTREEEEEDLRMIRRMMGVTPVAESVSTGAAPIIPPTPQSILYASVLSTDPDTLSRQLSLITTHAGPDTAASASAALPRLAALSPADKRLACEHAVNELRNSGAEVGRSRPGKPEHEVAKLFDLLIQADGEISFFGFMLSAILRNRLSTAPAESRQSTLDESEVGPEAVYALGILALAGNPADTVRSALAAGLVALRGFDIAPEQAVLPASPDLTRFETALRKLRRLPPQSVRTFLQAAEAVVMYDGHRTDSENFLLFAIADMLDAAGAVR